MSTNTLQDVKQIHCKNQLKQLCVPMNLLTFVRKRLSTNNYKDLPNDKKYSTKTCWYHVLSKDLMRPLNLMRPFCIENFSMSVGASEFLLRHLNGWRAKLYALSNWFSSHTIETGPSGKADQIMSTSTLQVVKQVVKHLFIHVSVKERYNCWRDIFSERLILFLEISI